MNLRSNITVESGYNEGVGGGGILYMWTFIIATCYGSYLLPRGSLLKSALSALRATKML